MNLNKDDETKQEIILAAKHSFSKWGLNKTTMEDIARDAGKSKSSLYYYYKSKEEIFEAVATAEFEAIQVKAQAEIDKLDFAKEKIKKYIIVVLNEIKNATNAYSLVRGELRANKEFIQRVAKKMEHQEEALIAKILQQGVESGELTFIKDSEVDVAARGICGIIRGLEMYLFLENTDSEMIDIVTRLIVSGM